MISCRIVELGLVTNNIKSQNSYEPSAVACRIKSWDSKHMCVISCRIVELGLATENKSQNSYEPSVVACRIEIELEKSFIYVCEFL